MTGPPIDYGRPEPRRSTYVSTPMGILLIIVATIVLLASGLMLNHPSRPRNLASQVRCASNLRQVGQAIMLYAHDNHGAFPPDLTTILSTQQISADAFICESTGDTKAPSPSLLSQPGHCSYIYVAAALAENADPNCIVIVEDPANHALKGGNVLFADGHVEFVNQSILMQYFNDLAAGRNPPSTTTTFTPATAEQDYKKNWQSRMPQLKSGIWSIPTTRPTTRPAQ